MGDSHSWMCLLLPKCQGLTAQVVSGQGRSGQVTQAVVVTLPSRGLTPPCGGVLEKRQGQSWPRC